MLNTFIMFSSSERLGFILTDNSSSRNPLRLRKSIPERMATLKVAEIFRRVFYNIGIEGETINHREK